MFINVIPQLEQCRSTSSVRMTFRRYRERTALWDHRTTLWARLRPALTKAADEWTRGRGILKNLKGLNLIVSVGLKLKETQKEY